MAKGGSVPVTVTRQQPGLHHRAVFSIAASSKEHCRATARACSQVVPPRPQARRPSVTVDIKNAASAALGAPFAILIADRRFSVTVDIARGYANRPP